MSKDDIEEIPKDEKRWWYNKEILRAETKRDYKKEWVEYYNKRIKKLKQIRKERYGE